MNVLERAALKVGMKHVWRSKVMGTALRRYASLFSVLFLALGVGLEATGNREAAETVRTIGGYVKLGEQAPIPQDQLLPLLAAIAAGVLAAFKLGKVLHVAWGGALPPMPLPEARQVLGLMGGVQTGPGAAAPVGNQDLGAAIAVIKSNPNGVVDGLKILLKVVLALFSRPKR